MQELFAKDPFRAEKYSLDLPELGIFLDYSKNPWRDAAFAELLKLPEQADLSSAIEALFSGEKLNFTEDRRAFHVALRNIDLAQDPDTRASLENMFSQMKSVVDQIALRSDIREIVHVGTGGSDLGPRLVCDAFQEAQIRRAHFISNADSLDASRVLANLNPRHTLTVITSKTFTTQETLMNLEILQAWYQAAGLPWQDYSIAVTAFPEHAQAFKTVLAFPSWVNGRYSLCSAVGLTIALSLGWEHFQALSKGAALMDEHFRSRDFSQNMPVILAVLEIANPAPTSAVMPYSQALRFLPAYLQQLVMESNGKSVNRQGQAVTEMTSRILWGDVGTNAQHSFFQLLHQGSHEFSIDFIGLETSSQVLLANMFSQAQALMIGRQQVASPHGRMRGNHPSNILLLKTLSPACLGALIALYEHKVYVESVIWGINAFDQFGVELGKQLAAKNLALLQGQAGQADDPSTQRLIERLRAS